MRNAKEAKGERRKEKLEWDSLRAFKVHFF
jgi:hypothetical protein